MARATDLDVETTFTEQGLDELVQQLGPAAVVEGTYRWDPLAEKGRCSVRVFGDPGFIRFALENQGYGTVLGAEEID